MFLLSNLPVFKKKFFNIFLAKDSLTGKMRPYFRVNTVDDLRNMKWLFEVAQMQDKLLNTDKKSESGLNLKAWLTDSPQTPCRLYPPQLPSLPSPIILFVMSPGQLTLWQYKIKLPWWLQSLLHNSRLPLTQEEGWLLSWNRYLKRQK